MRLDRVLTLAVFHPLGRVRPAGVERSLPVLMYHSISEEPEVGVSPYYQIATHPRIFSEQMALLKEEGFTGVTLSDGLATLESTESEWKVNPQKHVAITFDDGYRNFFTRAFPVLQKHRFSATVYLPTGFIGNEPKQFKSRECLAWREVVELHGAGVEFGSHTVSHPLLVDLNWPDVEKELRESKSEIEEHLGTAVTTFAYPYAFPQTQQLFVAQFRTLLDEVGYGYSVTTNIGRVRLKDDRLCLKRLPVNSHDDAALFRAKLLGAYDWMAGPQHLVKACSFRRTLRRQSIDNGSN